MVELRSKISIYIKNAWFNSKKRLYFLIEVEVANTGNKLTTLRYFNFSLKDFPKVIFYPKPFKGYEDIRAGQTKDYELKFYLEDWFYNGKPKENESLIKELIKRLENLRYKPAKAYLTILNTENEKIKKEFNIQSEII